MDEIHSWIKPAAIFQWSNSCVSVRLPTWPQEGSMDSLYEAVQSSSDGPPPPIPSRSSSRTCSRSCSPAVLLDDNTKWRGSGRSISMVRQNSHTKACLHTCMSYRLWMVEPCDQIVWGHFSEELGLLDSHPPDCTYEIKLIIKWWTAAAGQTIRDF